MDNNGSGMNIIVGIVAIIAILAVAYFAMQFLGQKSTTPSDSGTPSVNIDVNTSSAAGAR